MTHKPATDEDHGSQNATLDVLVLPGLSVHIFGRVVGIYSNRIDPGRGFVELPVGDLAAIVDHFSTAQARALLTLSPHKVG